MSEVSRRNPDGMGPEFWANRETAFRNELRAVLNQNSRENGSNTPDFILAEYLTNCLATWDKSVMDRERWYSRSDSRITPPTEFVK